ncbi:F0F1 ATP synthase subunit delta [Halovulum dunhuangense]|uniref:ATP synthase subunit delta n=1 Tax=Halovulum dunhuangense TaxID=1505036 RepID=A0A849KZD9_9RHOB|nr:F0F1 ATP synthase subunit delta [Halovulum dunhuangense]
MSDTASFTSGISGRYATALFELAREAGSIDAVEADLNALEAALAESDDLRALISSPIYSREQQAQAMRAVAAKMGLGDLVANTVSLMAAKRRLFALPQTIAGVKGLIAQERGEVTAEVKAAKALTEAQAAALAEALREAVGKDVVIKTTVDESLIGGLVVKLGSRMIDTSIRAKLSKLQNAMKEVG